MELLLPNKPSKEFTSFKVDNLVDNSITDFDLFIYLKNHFILYSGTGYKWERDELTQLLQTGYEQFFIRRLDIPKAEIYANIAKIPQIEKSLAPQERIKSIEQVGAKFIECLHKGEITEACVLKAESVASSLVDCIAEDKTCVQYLGALADHDFYTYYHSLRVAAYAVAVALQMGQSNEEVLRSIALGGIFHDIGKKDVPINIINKAGPLSDLEWKLMKSHPEKGFFKVHDSILSHVSREIILHHHEKRNGAGYPHGLDQRSLIQEVQIATLADIFDALTSSRSYQNKRTRFEALDFIKSRLIKDEVCPEAFKALILCLSDS